MNEPRYSKHAPKPTNAAMVKLNAKVSKAAEADDDIRRLKRELETAEKQKQQLVENEIPALMAECGQTMCITEQGLKVEIDTKKWANLPSPSAIMKEKDPERMKQLMDRRAEGLKWLIDNKHDNLIKRSFEIQFDRDEQAWAKKFKADLEKRKNKLHVTEGEDVNQNTLSALIRELAKAGKSYPAEALGVFDKTTAKISRVH